MFINIRLVYVNKHRQNVCMKVTRLGAKIRGLREAKNWSQSDLTRAAGLTHGLVSRLEDGTGNPSLKTLAAIAKALGVTISELLEGV
jgi:transcriptional regulator with XRE-family HTH domain